MCWRGGKQLPKEFKDSHFASSIVNICDFFPILKWVSYKGFGEEHDKNAENEVMMPKIVSKSHSAHVLKTTVAKQKQRKP